MDDGSATEVSGLAWNTTAWIMSFASLGFYVWQIIQIVILQITLGISKGAYMFAMIISLFWIMYGIFNQYPMSWAVSSCSLFLEMLTLFIIRSVERRKSTSEQQLIDNLAICVKLQEEWLIRRLQPTKQKPEIRYLVCAKPSSDAYKDLGKTCFVIYFDPAKPGKVVTYHRTDQHPEHFEDLPQHAQLINKQKQMKKQQKQRQKRKDEEQDSDAGRKEKDAKNCLDCFEQIDFCVDKTLVVFEKIVYFVWHQFRCCLFSSDGSCRCRRRLRHQPIGREDLSNRSELVTTFDDDNENSEDWGTVVEEGRANDHKRNNTTRKQQQKHKHPQTTSMMTPEEVSEKKRSTTKQRAKKTKPCCCCSCWLSFINFWRACCTCDDPNDLGRHTAAAYEMDTRSTDKMNAETATAATASVASETEDNTSSTTIQAPPLPPPPPRNQRPKRQKQQKQQQKRPKQSIATPTSQLGTDSLVNNQQQQQQQYKQRISRPQHDQDQCQQRQHQPMKGPNSLDNLSFDTISS